MRLLKLSYSDEHTRVPLPEMQYRVEFFFQYWTSLFETRPVSMDLHYLKSHRTIINKVRLQVEGNYKYAKGKINLFMVLDDVFDKNDLIIKRTKGKARRAINTLKRMVKASGQLPPAKRVLTQLNTLDQWLVTEYPQIVMDCTIDLMDKNDSLSAQDKAALMKLANYLIIELFNKGYNTKYIREIPQTLFDTEEFPYDRTPSDFSSKEEYQAYKIGVWSRLTLVDQVKAIGKLLGRPLKTRYLIYRVLDINFRIPPTVILGVEFYNPNNNPKIRHRFTPHFIEETFTLKEDEPYAKTSWCNACVEVEGIQEDQMYKQGYERVRAALAILNKEMKTQGRVLSTGVLSSNAAFDQLWGSTEAILGGISAINTLTADQIQRIQYFNQLDPLHDKDVVNLIALVNECLVDSRSYNPEKLWMILEATFGGEAEVKAFFFNAFKIYLKNNFLRNWKLFFVETLDAQYNFAHRENEYVLERNQLDSLGLTMDFSLSGLQAFESNLVATKDAVVTPYIAYLVEHISSYATDKPKFYDLLKKWIDYILTELYVERNLKVHSNMSDELFLLKRKELFNLVNVVVEVFVHQYLKTKRRKDIDIITSKIYALAQAIV
jgi:hypothetical protein